MPHGRATRVGLAAGLFAFRGRREAADTGSGSRILARAKHRRSRTRMMPGFLNIKSQWQRRRNLERSASPRLQRP